MLSCSVACYMHLSAAWGHVWSGSTWLRSPAWKKPGPAWYPANTESKAFKSEYIPTKDIWCTTALCGARRQTEAIELGTFDGRVLCTGSDRWNKTLPRRSAARAMCLTWNVPEVLNYSCTKLNLFPHRRSVLVTSDLPPQFKVVGSGCRRFVSLSSEHKELWRLKCRAPEIVFQGPPIIHQRPPAEP